MNFISYQSKLNSIIETIETARRDNKKLNMGSWQNFDVRVCETFDQFLICGTTCCFAGYVALDRLFQLSGGRTENDPSSFNRGAPIIGDRFGHQAIAAYLGWGEQFTSMFCFIDPCAKYSKSHEFYKVTNFKEISFENLLDKLDKIKRDIIVPELGSHDTIPPMIVS